MQWYIISIQEIILEVDGHHLSILIDLCKIWHLLTISAAHICTTNSITFTSSSSLLLLILLLILSVIRLLLLLNWRWLLLLDGCVVSSIDKVIYVSIIISLCRLIRGKFPLAIYYKFIKMDSSFECLD
jgi:hypothetical protein